MERSWIGPVLLHDPELAGAHQHLLRPAGRHGRFPAAAQALNETAIPVIAPFTEREREVLRHVSVMLTTTEIASELFISHPPGGVMPTPGVRLHHGSVEGGSRG